MQKDTVEALIKNANKYFEIQSDYKIWFPAK